MRKTNYLFHILTGVFFITTCLGVQTVAKLTREVRNQNVEITRITTENEQMKHTNLALQRKVGEKEDTIIKLREYIKDQSEFHKNELQKIQKEVEEKKKFKLSNIFPFNWINNKKRNK